jgi:hypothetical protein
MLVAEHAAAYAGLLSEELAARSAQLKQRPALQQAGIACLLVASTLAGVALLLWTSSPVTDGSRAMALCAHARTASGAGPVRDMAGECL